MKKKEKKANLPVKAKSTELITVHQEKANPLDITQKLHHLKKQNRGKKTFARNIRKSFSKNLD